MFYLFYYTKILKGGVIMNQIQLKQIKENIRTINPIFTDELLDLLYEYFKMCQNQSHDNYVQALKQDKDFTNFIQEITLGLTLRK